MQKDELAKQKQQKLDKLNELITSTKESAKSIAKDMRNKLELLKVCYERSSSKQKNKVHELTNYSQLICYLTEKPFSNSYETKPIELKHLVYTERSINRHIENGLPKNNNEQAVEIYSFYFGGYRAFFRCFTKEFLDLRIKQKKEFIDDVFSPKEEEDYNVSEERLAIDGIKIIDKAFIEKVKTGKHFTEPEFYGATQNNDCQWYGIIHEYDIVRKGYDDLKKVIVDSFVKEKHEKVTAVVCGSAGSGKSTALRRIAVDLHQEPIHIVWVEDDNIEAFIEKGFPVIKNEVEKNENQKFLIIIEDWYRIFKKENEKLGIDILKKAKSINNIRIVIGDRTIEKPYTDHRNNDFELHLSSNDNKEIIEKIIEKYPDWKLASEKLFNKKNDKNYKSSLFLLLFILARIDQKEFNNTALNLAEPQQVFQRIIESDLRFIEKKYKGLAKALYYWGCVYAEHKIFISYMTFLHIADFYTGNGNTEVSDLFTRWDIKNAVLDRLKIYINKNNQIEEYENKDFIQFNHDVLAEIGLRNSKLEDWDEFDDTIKIQLLKIITDKADNYSASKFLGTMLSKEQQIFIDLEDKLYFIKKLIEKNNRDQYYLLEFSYLVLKNEQLIQMAQLIWSKKIDSVLFWGQYFRQIKNDDIICKYASEILDKKYLTVYNPDFIGIVLKYTPDTQIKNDFIRDILFGDDIENIPERIIFDCLKYATDEEKKDFSDKFLINDTLDNTLITRKCLTFASEFVKKDFFTRISQIKIWERQGIFKIIDALLHFLNNKDKRTFSDKVLKDNNWNNINPNIIVLCYEYSSIEEKKRLSNKVLKEENYKFVDSSFLIKCLNFSSNNVKFSFLERISQNADWSGYNKPFFDIFFEYSSNSIRKTLSNKYLRYPHIWKNINYKTQEISFEYAEKETKRIYFSQLVKDSFVNNKRYKIFDNHYLEYFENEKDIPVEIQEAISLIIEEREEPHWECKRDYNNLLRINFFYSSIWKKETERIIDNWENEKSFTLSCTLYGYRSQPIEVKGICSEILSQWKKLINLDLDNRLDFNSQSYNLKIRLGLPLEIALGHPDLKSQAKITATEILNAAQLKDFAISWYLKEIAEQIVENDIYPEWKTIENDDDDHYINDHDDDDDDDDDDEWEI